MAMPYPPALPLPVPAAMPPVPAAVEGLYLPSIGLIRQEEELSNQQLSFTVRLGLEWVWIEGLVLVL